MKIFKKILIVFAFVVVLAGIYFGTHIVRNKDSDDNKGNDESGEIDTPTIEKVTITFDIDGEKSSIQVNKGDLITFPADPTKVGYTFNGWKNEDDYYNATTPAIADLVLVASFTINSYTLTIDCDNGEIETKQVEYGSSITLTEPTKVGYTFKKWDNDIKTMPASDVTIKALYTINTYQVTIKYHDEVTEDTILHIEYLGKINVINPTRDGYIFKGWNIEIPEEVTEDITLEAQWEVIKYTLTIKNFYAIGENYAVKFAPGETIQFVPPTLFGATLQGYNEQEDGTGTMITLDKMPANDLTVYCIWSYINYTITYNLDGGSCSEPLKETYQVIDSTITLPSVVKEGYYFKGWVNVVEDVETPIQTIDPTKAIDYSLKAIFTQTKFAISYILNEGVLDDAPTSFDINTGLIELKNPTKEGYVFRGWYNDSYTTQITHIDTTVASDVTVYALWAQKIAYPTLVDKTYIYNKTKQSVEIENKLDETYYTITGDSEATEAGKYSFKVTLASDKIWMDEKTDDFNLNWEIKQATIDAASLVTDKVTYNEKEQEIAIKEVKAGEVVLDEANYQVTKPSSIINAGSYQVTIEGVGSVTGSIKLVFTIEKADYSFTLTNNAIQLTCEASYDLSTLVQGQKGSLTYQVKTESTTVDYTLTNAIFTANKFNDSTSSKTYEVVITDNSDNYITKEETVAITISRKDVEMTLSEDVSLKINETLATSSIKLDTKGSDGAITYEIINGTDYIKLENNTLTGLAYNGSNLVSLKATLAQTAVYNASTLTFSVTVNKLDGLKSLNLNYVSNKHIFQPVIETNETGLTYTYQWWNIAAGSSEKTTLSTKTTYSLPSTYLTGEFGLTVSIGNSEKYETTSVTKSYTINEAIADTTQIVAYLNQTVPLTFTYNSTALNIVAGTEHDYFNPTFFDSGVVYFCTSDSDYYANYYLNSYYYNLVALDNNELSFYYTALELHVIDNSSDTPIATTGSTISYIAPHSKSEIVYLPTHYNQTKITTVDATISNASDYSFTIVLPKTITTVTEGSFQDEYLVSVYFMGSSEEFEQTHTNYKTWGDDTANTTVVGIYIRDSNANYERNYSFYINSPGCLIKGTPVLLADGSTKMIEDINYDDLLMVADLMNGGYTYEYPLWIEKTSTVYSYTRVTFSDGTSINMKGAHSLFNSDTLKFVDNGSELKEGIHVYKFDYATKSYYSVQVTKIEEISEEVQVYHVFSTTMYNIIASDLVTTWYGEVLNNFYSYDSNLKMNETERAIALSDSYTEEEISVLPHYLYVGFRVNETKAIVKNGIMTKEEWIAFLANNTANESFFNTMPTVTINGEEKRVFNVCTTCDFVTQKVLEGDTFTLKEGAVLEGKTFIGYRNSVDNKIYYAGDKVTIECSTCFIAIYE